MAEPLRCAPGVIADDKNANRGEAAQLVPERDVKSQGIGDPREFVVAASRPPNDGDRELVPVGDEALTRPNPLVDFLNGFVRAARHHALGGEKSLQAFPIAPREGNDFHAATQFGIDFGDGSGE